MTRTFTVDRIVERDGRRVTKRVWEPSAEAPAWKDDRPGPDSPEARQRAATGLDGDPPSSCCFKSPNTEGMKSDH